jgi:hypothetical protein
MVFDMTPREEERIDELARSDRPLVVCDIDDVVMEFVAPFKRFLDSHGHDLRLTSFRLHGNVYVKRTGEPADKTVVSEYLESFFGEHDAWQKPVSGALESLNGLRDSHGADIIFLTAMPPRHHARRRALLDLHGFSAPMIATEDAKGDAIAVLLRHNPGRPVAFIDDLPNNHFSVRQMAPSALTVHLMAYSALREHLPPLPEGVIEVDDWPQATAAISRHFEKALRGS